MRVNIQMTNLMETLAQTPSKPQNISQPEMDECSCWLSYCSGVGSGKGRPTNTMDQTTLIRKVTMPAFRNERRKTLRSPGFAFMVHHIKD